MALLKKVSRFYVYLYLSLSSDVLYGLIYAENVEPQNKYYFIKTLWSAQMCKNHP